MYLSMIGIRSSKINRLNGKQAPSGYQFFAIVKNEVDIKFNQARKILNDQGMRKGVVSHHASP